MGFFTIFCCIKAGKQPEKNDIDEKRPKEMKTAENEDRLSTSELDIGLSFGEMCSPENAEFIDRVLSDNRPPTKSLSAYCAPMSTNITRVVPRSQMLAQNPSNNSQA